MVERLLERAKTSGRVDDNEETIKKRLKTFHDHSDKVLAHYESKSLLCKVSVSCTLLCYLLYDWLSSFTLCCYLRCDWL